MARPIYCSVVLFALVLSNSIAVLSGKPARRGFSLPLIHRESLNSALHDQSHTRYARIRSAISRSIVRARWISTMRSAPDITGSVSDTSVPSTEIISDKGEYLMNISIGTPPFPILAIADTGSDLTWTQCAPCKNCYEQKSKLFDPRKSSTYRPISCSASQCSTEASGFSPSCESNKCTYSVGYGDQSTSYGSIAAETLTLGSAKFPKTTFGCGFENQGTFSPDGSGIIGLGNGPNSLIGQLDESIGGKFSYCLVPLSSSGSLSSQINFGENAVVSGEDVVTTELVDGDPITFYYLTLNAITVGDKRVPFTSGSGSSFEAARGNIIIDSGTTLLILPQDFYEKVASAIQDQISDAPVNDPSGQLGLCYNSDGFQPPKLVSNFDRANVELNDFNAWLPISDDIICFAAAPSDMGIYGNVAQMNFLVGYDKAKGSVSFKPADCTKQK